MTEIQQFIKLIYQPYTGNQLRGSSVRPTGTLQLFRYKSLLSQYQIDQTQGMSSFDSWSLSPTNYKHGTLFTPQSTILACLRTSVFNQWLLDFIIITIINIGLCLLSVFHVLCSTLLLLLLQIIIIVHRPHSHSIHSTLH